MVSHAGLDDEQLQPKIARHVTFCARGETGMVLRGSQAEYDTVQLLVDNLSLRQVGDYRILVNYNMPRHDGGATGTLEMDLVLINRFGIFVIEVKDWRGWIDAYDSHWVQNGEERGNAFISVNEKAKALQTTWFSRGRPLGQMGRVSVTGLIVLARGKGAFRNHSNHSDQVVIGLDAVELSAAVSSTRLLHSHNAPLLSNQDILQVQSKLFVEHKPLDRIIVDRYQIVKDLAVSPLYRTFEAVNIHLDIQRVRIKLYQLQDISSGAKGTIERFKQSARAVTMIGAHPNIVQTLNLFPHPDRPDVFYEVTEWVKGDRLDELLVRKQPLAYDRQLDMIEALCAALSHAHRQQVYHRNLSPTTVFVTSEGVVKLADFDFAKISGGSYTTISDPEQPPQWDRLTMAPELQMNPSAASPASDIYSLGVLWYTMARQPAADPNPSSAKVGGLALPPLARALIEWMLSTAVSKRPQRADVVLEQARALRS